MTRRAALAGTLLIAVIALGVAPPSGMARASGVSTAHTTKKVVVDIIGDSLADQASNYLASDLDPFTAVLHASTFGGTALCDWVFPHMRTTATGIVTSSTPGTVMNLTAATAPNVAILQFVGNRATACISTNPFSLAGFLINYHYCLTAAINHLLAIGVRHIVVDAGPPSKSVIPGEAPLRSLFKEIVATYHRSSVVYASGADNSVLSAGKFAWNLPCLEIETATGVCTGPVVANVQTDVVRSSDGVHFCPETRGVNGLIPFFCSVYSSGAYRYAQAFASLIWSYYPLSEPHNVPVISSVAPDVGPSTGGVAVTLTGYSLATVRTVQFVELFVPLLNGVELPGGTPVTLVVTAAAPADVTTTSMMVMSPPIASSARGEAEAVFIRVITSRAESVIGLTSDGFYLSNSSSPSANDR